MPQFDGITEVHGLGVVQHPLGSLGRELAVVIVIVLRTTRLLERLADLPSPNQVENDELVVQVHQSDGLGFRFRSGCGFDRGGSFGIGDGFIVGNGFDSGGGGLGLFGRFGGFGRFGRFDRGGAVLGLVGDLFGRLSARFGSTETRHDGREIR